MNTAPATVFRDSLEMPTATAATYRKIGSDALVVREPARARRPTVPATISTASGARRRKAKGTVAPEHEEDPERVHRLVVRRRDVSLPGGADEADDDEREPDRDVDDPGVQPAEPGVGARRGRGMAHPRSRGRCAVVTTTILLPSHAGTRRLPSRNLALGSGPGVCVPSGGWCGRRWRTRSRRAPRSTHGRSCRGRAACRPCRSGLPPTGASSPRCR